MDDNFENLSGLPDVDFDRGDLSLPRWKIDKKTGFFVNTMSGQEVAQMEAVIIKCDKGRFMWPSEFSMDNKMPLCHSVNGIYPVDQSGVFGCEINGHFVCAGCPFAEWKNGQKPMCSISYNYLLYDMETEMLSVLSLSRSRAKTAKALNSFWKLNGVKFSLLIYTELATGKKGEFFGVKFQIAQKLAREIWLPFAVQMVKSKSLLLTGSITEIEQDDSEDELAENGQPKEFDF